MAQDAIINRWDINGDVYDIQDAGRGRPLGVATLDENGRVPYTQLPESAVEFKGYWNASTNTPTLHDGTGTKGDLYYVDVAGTQDLGSGSQVFEVGDRVLYDGSVWKNMKSGGTDIEVYPTMADLEQNLPNLEDGTIVATEEGDNFTTVDTVQSGVFNPVTSNAVAQALDAVAPVDTVQSGVLNPVTSNAVAQVTSGMTRVKTADYVWSGTMSSVYEQIQIPLSAFASDINPNKVIGFTVLYWTGFQAIANGDWYDSSGLACALTCLKTGTGRARVRCSYFV
jgi:hypothetical protein